MMHAGIHLTYTNICTGKKLIGVALQFATQDQKSAAQIQNV